MPSLGELFGFVAALWVIAIVLWIGIALMRAFLGNTGTALVLLMIAVSAAWMGWKWLAFNDNLALQMLGWGIVSALVFGALKGLQILVRKHAAEPAKPEILGVSEPMA